MAASAVKAFWLTLVGTHSRDYRDANFGTKWSTLDVNLMAAGTMVLADMCMKAPG